MCHEQELVGICRYSLQWRQVQHWVSGRTVCWGHSRGTAVFLMCKVTAAHSSAGMELFACCGVQGKTLGTGLFIPTLGKTKGGLKVSKTLMVCHSPTTPSLLAAGLTLEELVECFLLVDGVER